MGIYSKPEIGPEELAALERIDGLRNGLRYRLAAPRRWYGPVRRVLAARAIQGSNSIEGFHVSVEDAVAAVEGDEPTEAEHLDWMAVSSYRRAMTYVLQLALDQHFEYTAALLRSLHFMMTEYSLDAGPGLWRPGPIWVQNDATGDVVYEAPGPDTIPALIEELIADLRRDEDLPTMVKGAMAHLNLVMIHPFRDGNGRMARCLQTLVLAREGILNQEFCSIEEYLGRNTREYYDVLAEVGQGHWAPDTSSISWVRFCLKAHYIQAYSVLRRVSESETMWGELEALAKQHGLPERTAAAMFDAAIGMRVRNALYRSILGDESLEPISNQTATSDLGALVRAGLLEQRGRKRGTFYVCAAPLRELYEEVRSQREPISTSDLFQVAG